MAFSGQKYWRRLLFPPPGKSSQPRIEPVSPALAGGFFTIEQPGNRASQMQFIIIETQANWGAVRFPSPSPLCSRTTSRLPPRTGRPRFLSVSGVPHQTALRAVARSPMERPVWAGLTSPPWKWADGSGEGQHRLRCPPRPFRPGMQDAHETQPSCRPWSRGRVVSPGISAEVPSSPHLTVFFGYSSRFWTVLWALN